MVALLAVILSTTAIAAEDRTPPNLGQRTTATQTARPEAKHAVSPSTLVDIRFPTGKRATQRRMKRHPARTRHDRQRLDRIRPTDTANPPALGAPRSRSNQRNEAKRWVPEAFSERPAVLSPPKPTYQRLR
jgi:hypothetical protein